MQSVAVTEMVCSIFFMRIRQLADLAQVDRPKNLERIELNGSWFKCTLHGPGFLLLHFSLFQKYNFCEWHSRQAHECKICLNLVIAILRCASHCAETGHFLPPFFWGGGQYTTPLVQYMYCIFNEFCSFHTLC